MTLAQKLLDYVILDKRDRILETIFPYAAALVTHKDPVMIAANITTKFGFIEQEIDWKRRSPAPALSASGDFLKSVGPLLRLFGVVVSVIVLLSLGRMPEVFDFVKKLVGGSL
jgi:hypothetical protein